MQRSRENKDEKKRKRSHGEINLTETRPRVNIKFCMSVYLQGSGFHVYVITLQWHNRIE